MNVRNVSSLLLAAALQVLPITRVFVATSPATGSSFAIVSTWIAGAVALLGSYHAVSGASTTITSAKTARGTNGVAFSYRITTGPDVANTFAASPLPSGLTVSTTTGRITGTPTVDGTFVVLMTASDNGQASRTVTANLTLTIVPPVTGGTPPSITTQPVSQTVTAGGSASFSVVAGGTAPLGYQWRRNGANVSGASGTTLSLSGVTTNQAGSYTVVVTNSSGSVTSSPATLMVNVPVVAPAITAQPQSQTVTAGGSASFSVGANGTAPLSYQWRLNGADVSGANGAAFNLSGVTTNQAGNYTVLVSNSAGSVTSSPVILTVNVAPTIATQPQGVTVTAGGSASFSVGANGTAPLTYQWRFNGANVSGATSASLNLSGVTTNQAGSYTVLVGNTAGSVTSSPAILTVNVAPTITTQPQSVSVTEGSGANFSVVAGGTAPLSYQWRLNGANVSGATSAALSLSGVTTNQTGSSYTVLISNSAGSVTSSPAILTVTAGVVPPSITSQPQGLTVTAGSNATIIVGATGTAPLTYQWRLNGVNVSGATGATLVLTSVTTNQAGNYTILVNNSAGSVTSSPALLTVNPAIAPTITTQPQSQTVIVGTNVTFTVAATGTAPLVYQWRVNGANLANATGTTLTLTGVSTNQAGSYTVLVTNFAGSVTSSPAILTVNPPPVVPDTTPPTLVVASPAAGFTEVSADTLTLSGTAADDRSVASVSIQHGSGSYFPASGTTNWNAQVALSVGTNIFKIKATDAAGNNSTTNTRVVVYAAMAPLALTINGDGSVTPYSNGQMLQVGQSYSLTATPQSNSSFNNWIMDGTVVSGSTLTLTMSASLTITANFTSNATTATNAPSKGIAKASYTGLFYPNVSPLPYEQSGAFTIAVTDKGSFSGKVQLAGGNYSLRGDFAADRSAKATLQGAGTSGLQVTLQLSAAGDEITGSIGDGTWRSDLYGYRAPFDSKNQATAFAGKYTTLLLGGDDPYANPGGTGFGQVTVSTSGKVLFKGLLGDGSPAAVSVPVAANGQVAFFAKLYRGKGWMLGWLTVTNAPDNDIPGVLAWTRKGEPGGGLYLGSFDSSVSTLGSRYTPTKGDATSGLENALVVLNGGNLYEPSTNTVTHTGPNTLAATGTATNAPTLKVAPATGLIKGGFMNSESKNTSAIKGVLLQKQNMGGGYFISNSKAGSVLLLPAATTTVAP